MIPRGVTVAGLRQITKVTPVTMTPPGVIRAELNKVPAATRIITIPPVVMPAALRLILPEIPATMILPADIPALLAQMVAVIRAIMMRPVVLPVVRRAIPPEIPAIMMLPDAIRGQKDTENRKIFNFFKKRLAFCAEIMYISPAPSATSDARMAELVDALD